MRLTARLSRLALGSTCAGLLLAGAACAGPSAESSVARPGDRAFRCEDGRRFTVRVTDPDEVAVDLGDRRLYLRRQADGQTYRAKYAVLVLEQDRATLTTPPDAAKPCKPYDPGRALPPPGFPSR